VGGRETEEEMYGVVRSAEEAEVGRVVRSVGGGEEELYGVVRRARKASEEVAREANTVL